MEPIRVKLIPVKFTCQCPNCKWTYVVTAYDLSTHEDVVLVCKGCSTEMLLGEKRKED